MRQLLNISVSHLFVFGFVISRAASHHRHLHMLVLVGVFVLSVERNTSVTMSRKSGASNPSIRSRASNEMISDSVGP